MTQLMASAYIRLAVHHPCILLTGMMLLALPTAYFGVVNFSLSDPEGGQLVRDSQEAEQGHAFAKAVEMARDGFSVEVYEPQQTQPVPPLKLFYTAGHTSRADTERTENVLTVPNIQRIAALEDELLALSGGEAWNEVCLRDRGAQTCAPFLSAIPYLRNATDEASLHQAIDALYLAVDAEASSPLGSTRAAWFFEQGKSTSRYESYILRTHVRLGAPIAVGDWLDGGNASRFVNREDRLKVQRARMMARFLTPAEARLREVAHAWGADAAAPGAPPSHASLLFAQDWLYEREYTDVIASDLMFALGSLGCVYVMLCTYISSPLLALLGLLQILLAFPITLYLYAVVLRIKLFGVLQASAACIPHSASPYALHATFRALHPASCTPHPTPSTRTLSRATHDGARPRPGNGHLRHPWDRRR